MQLKEVVKKLSGAKRSQSGFIAKCPAHTDEKQSLSIDSAGGKVLLNCFAGCRPEQIVEAMGLEFKDLFEGCAPHDLSSRSFRRDGVSFYAPPKAKVAAVYRYTDASGQVLYENVRFEPKGFSQRRMGADGKYIWDLRGVTRVPYRLPDLLKVRHGADVWLCEGEKDADSLAELGFTASSFKNWHRDFNQYIKKTNVIIVRDHDLPGGVQANEAARVIQPAAASLKVLDVHAEYEMPEKHGPDISDYIKKCVVDEGMTPEEIAERLSLMVDGSQRWTDPNIGTANLFVVKTGNQWLQDASSRPSPKRLFGDFWFENELCILFADTNVGKSILAVQIGDLVSRGVVSGQRSVVSEEKTASPPITSLLLATDHRSLATECEARRVVYFDFELTDKQFEARMSERGEYHRFHENFSRAELDPETSELHGFKDFEEFLNHSLDRTIVEQNAEVLIIDNLTYLRDETENARNALPLMKYLKELKSRHEISILALAHTPKRDASKPLTRNDLQGSKMLINFCDSSFAIGESQRDQGVRYLKQIKARNAAIVHHADNVLLGTIEKRNNLLQFVFAGTGSEREHLKEPSDRDKSAMIEKAKAMAAEGKKLSEIASELGISKTTTSRYVNSE